MHLNVKEKKIFPIDFGQLESFLQRDGDRYDPRMVLANFMRALSSNDVDSLIHYAGFMSDNADLKDQEGLKSELREILGAEKSLLKQLPIAASASVSLLSCSNEAAMLW